MRVHVVMGNDYPEAVFTDEGKAHAFCERKRVESEKKHSGRSMIYWRVNDFELDKEVDRVADVQ